jgi:DDE superfamily endonuclease
MEDLLEWSAEPYDALSPVVGCDESPDPWVSETRQPRPLAPGRPARDDDEYRREGTCHVCMCFPPLAGWRHVEVTARRTAQDCAPGMQAWVDASFPHAERRSVVLDHRHTHTPAALYATCPPAAARRRVRTLDLRDTPAHASWLHMAELACAGVEGQCRDRRLSIPALVRREVAAGEAARHAAKATVQWQLTGAKARQKRRHLSPA